MKPLQYAAFLLCAAGFASAQETVTEPSTGKAFPLSVSVTSEGKEFSLSLTGVTVRKKFFFKVYGMAHYMNDPVKGTEEEAFAQILKEGKSKQIIMEFARDVGVSQIQDAYRDGFRTNASAEDFKRIQPMVDQFVGYFTDGVKDGDRFVLTWIPGGTVIAVMRGAEKKPITDQTFARALWSIWFGEDSIVDREELVARVTGN
jgi:hypothetical protein